jgi:hypothetical protein
LNGLNTVDLTVTPPTFATGVFFYGTSDDGTQYSSGNTGGTINTGTLANGVWTFVAAASNASGNSANSPSSSPVIRVLPDASTRLMLTAGPAWCFTIRNSVSTPAGNGDPVGTWLDRATGNWVVAVSDSARGTLLNMGGGNWTVQTDGVDDQYLTNWTLGFGDTAFTLSVGFTPASNTAGSARSIFGCSTSGALLLGAHSNANLGFVQSGQFARPFAATTISNTVNAVASYWTSAPLPGVALVNATVTARVNGGANSANTTAGFQTANGAQVLLAGCAGVFFAGYIWGVTFAKADLSTGTGLPALEGQVRAKTP